MNRVFLHGRIGRDAETKYFSNGGSVTNFSLATSEKWRDKETGEIKEKTEWHNISCKGSFAERALRMVEHGMLSKGRELIVEGSIETRKWEQNGENRYTTEIVVSGYSHNIAVVGGGQQQEGGGQSQQRQPQQQRRAPPSPNKLDDFDDDIPF